MPAKLNYKFFFLTLIYENDIATKSLTVNHLIKENQTKRIIVADFTVKQHLLLIFIFYL
jgi:hypothetical protein